MKKKLFIPLAVLILTLTVVPTLMPANAEVPAEKASSHPVVSEQLSDFKSTVAELRREADTLNSFMPGNQMSWQTHNFSLNRLKNHVNDLGKTLARMEALKPESGDIQQMAIENARPHLSAIALNLTQAIELVNTDRNSINHSTEYADAVRSVYQHSDSLYEKMDTLLDYESARSRFNSLEL
jgi:hypothetical protein